MIVRRGAAGGAASRFSLRASRATHRLSITGRLETARNGEQRPMKLEAAIREKLLVALEPTRLDVINESHQHAGHASSPGTGESHFRVLIVSSCFAGKPRLERHRMVNAALAAELKGGIHALAIHAYAPGETVRE